MPYCDVVCNVVIAHKIKTKYPVIYISLVIQTCTSPKVVGVVRKLHDDRPEMATQGH